MKALIVLFSVLATSVAFANVDIQSMTWGEILSDSSLRTANDIVFQNGRGLGATWKRSTSVCQDGTYLYGGKTTVQVCSDEDGKDVCEAPVTVKLVAPINGQQTVQMCDDDDKNCEMVTRPFVQSPSRSIAVMAKDSNDEWVSLGNKAYTIPFCADLGPADAN